MISLDQEYQAYQGQSVLVQGADSSLAGQCFMWFDFVIHDIYGLPYFYAPGAIDIWEAPGVLTSSFTRIPYTPAMQLQPGDIVIYGAPLGYDSTTNRYNGHVSLVAKPGIGSNYTGYDSNWSDSKKLQTIVHSDKYNQYILGILRSTLGGQMTDKNQIGAFTWAFYGRAPRQTELDTYGSLSLQETINRILTSQEYLDFYNYRNTALATASNADVQPYSGPQLFTKKA